MLGRALIAPAILMSIGLPVAVDAEDVDGDAPRLEEKAAVLARFHS